MFICYDLHDHRDRIFIRQVLLTIGREFFFVKVLGHRETMVIFSAWMNILIENFIGYPLSGIKTENCSSSGLEDHRKRMCFVRHG